MISMSPSSSSICSLWILSLSSCGRSYHEVRGLDVVLSLLAVLLSLSLPSSPSLS